MFNEEQKEEAKTPQQGAEGESAQETNSTFSEATATREGETLSTDAETFLAEETYAGSQFVENTNPDRAVGVLAARNGSAVLRLMRTGSNESNGCFIKSVDVSAAFGMNLSRYAPKTQVSLKLANGSLLTGYISIGKTRKGFYFPKKLAERVHQLPKVGKRLPVKTTMLIVG